tara:strand:- start:1523 stop:2221 length:699 start_codon:yes stop_codon:yes gene_type:complete
MKRLLSCILEELFPLLIYLKNKRNILKNIGNSIYLADKSKHYTVLGEVCIRERIKEEHERAIKIDEKTSKFTLGLSVSLTVLAAASGAFAKLVPESAYAAIISMTCGVASIYMLLAGITALGALKTLATYGYGTEHLINQKNEGIAYLSQALFAQEKVNIVRQLRNEAAYQSLRNGFIVLLFSLTLSLLDLTSQQLKPVVESNKSEVSDKVDAIKSNAGNKLTQLPAHVSKN